MTRTLTTLVTLTALLAASGCGTPGTDLASVLPDERIKINLPVGDGTKALDPADREWAQFYLLTAEVTEDVNGLIGWMLYTVHDVTTSYPPSEVNADRTEATWGPYSKALDPVETQIRVLHDLESDAYDWSVEQWPKADETAVYDVVLGEVDPGATEVASTGRFTVDYTTAHALDPTVDLVGSFDVDYEIREDGASATVDWTDFGDASRDASYVYDETADGSGTMDLAVQADVNGNGTLETLVIRSRWTASGAGRSDAFVTGGDLGDVQKTASECWDGTFARVFYVGDFTSGVGTSEGDLGACSFTDTQYSTLALPTAG